MTYSDALEYLFGIPRFSKTLTLERIGHLLSALGDPHKHLKFVHIAGTNGKGSVTTMLSEILTSSGLRCGRFISPFVEDFRERICVDGEFIPKHVLAELTHRVSEIISSMPEEPNAFEQMCAIAMKYFEMSRCDIVCLEVGLGGKWDATNIIPPPLVSVITSIGLDHMQYLGDTPEAIAREKCGIIKPGCFAIASPLQPTGVLQVISEDCTLKGVNLSIPSLKDLTYVSLALGGTEMCYMDETYNISLQGEHQVYNAMCAIAAAHALIKQGLPITQADISLGIKRAYLPARMEILSRMPLCIVDGGHNAPGIDALCASLDTLCGNMKLACIFGCLQDKSAQQMAERLAERADLFLCVSPDSPKACSPEELCGYAAPFCSNVRACASLCDAVNAALEFASGAENRMLLACGSLYLAGPVKAAIYAALDK